MKLGIGSYAYRWSIGIKDIRPDDPMTPMRLLHKAAALGVELLQYADNLPLHSLSDTEVCELAQEAKALGITLELGVQGLECNLLLRYLELARVLDAKLIRIALDADDAAKPLVQIEHELADLLPPFEAEGVWLAIENHFHIPSSKLVTIINDIDHPSLGVCLDVANSIAVQEWPQETVALLAPYALNLHLKDYRIVLDRYGVGLDVVGTPLGQGLLDIAHVFRALADAGREVNVVIEHWLPRSSSLTETLRLEDDWCRQSLNVARNFIPLSVISAKEIS